ncbi:MAG TPA: LytTR family DNA-binding domain-containing protein [Kofleriaceae bacterium]|nr:LytTR family DNA-binding domain-containing protein [Kofleriaceae bacterium]
MDLDQLADLSSIVDLRPPVAVSHAPEPCVVQGPRRRRVRPGRMLGDIAFSVDRFWASDKYTVYERDGVEHMTEESLASLAARLAQLGYMQIHRGELVRVAAIRRVFDDCGSWEAELHDGQIARVGRRKVGQLRQLLRQQASQAQ